MVELVGFEPTVAEVKHHTYLCNLGGASLSTAALTVKPYSGTTPYKKKVAEFNPSAVGFLGYLRQGASPCAGGAEAAGAEVVGGAALVAGGAAAAG